ncbi:MAG: hypothetical protein AAF937_06960 [Planctomycetota bacterium]
MPNARTLLAALTCIAPTAAAQTCADLDINGCGCLDFSQFTSMVALVASGDPADSPTGNGDYDNDGDVDGIDFAFWLANFVPCSADINGPTRTTAPETGGVFTVARSAAFGAGNSQYEILAVLADPLDEVVSVTFANVTLSSAPGVGARFLDPNQGSDAVNPLGQAVYDSLGIDADTYIAIGDRTDEPTPVIPILPELDEPAFADRVGISAPLGWHGDFLNTGTPTVSGAGGASGNQFNEVLLLGIALSNGVFADVDIEFAVATADGRLLVTRETVRAGVPCLADVNGNGMLTLADLNAWILAFNTQAFPECDQNQNGICNPADFNAWVVNFFAGCY